MRIDHNLMKYCFYTGELMRLLRLCFHINLIFSILKLIENFLYVYALINHNMCLVGTASLIP